MDIAPEKVGADFGTLAGIDELGMSVTDDPATALKAAPDVVFHATVSSLVDARPQLEDALATGGGRRP